MPRLVLYVDPGTSSVVITTAWQYIGLILSIIAGIFLSGYKSVKNVVKKFWESMKRVL